MIIDYKNVVIANSDGNHLLPINLSISEGEFCMCLGEDVASKSALIRSLYGEQPIISGTATVLDYVLSGIAEKRRSELRREIGLNFREYELIEEMTVNQILDIILSSKGVVGNNEKEDKKRNILQRMGIETLSEKEIDSLSYEEKRLLSIAMSLVTNPKLLLIDNPVEGLNQGRQELIMSLIYEISSEMKMTTLISTHDQQLMKSYPSRALWIRDRQIQE